MIQIANDLGGKAGPDLHAELRASCQAVTRLRLRQLVGLGISWATIGELGRHHYGFGVIRAVPADDGLYVPGDGEPHLLLPVYEDGELIDLCAFRSGDPLNWLLRTGLGWALGLEDGIEPLAWAESVGLAVSPLEWLREGATGVCILDWDAPVLRYLSDLPHLVCSSNELATRLRAALARPVRFPTISVGETHIAA